MFGLSFPELIVVMAVILIAFGPAQLPQAAKRFGKLMADLRRASDSVRREFYNAMYQPAEDVKNLGRDTLRELTSLPNRPPQPPAGPDEQDCESETAKNPESPQK